LQNISSAFEERNAFKVTNILRREVHFADKIAIQNKKAILTKQNTPGISTTAE
jgi:hypothetical protein